MSLIELIVAVLLGFIVAGILTAAFLYSLRMSAQGTTRSSLQMTASLALRRIERELQQTSPDALTVSSSGLSAVTVKNVSSTGSLEWSEERVLYYWTPGTKALYRKTLPVTGLFQLTPTELQDAFAASGRRTLVAGDVKRFEVTQGTVLTLVLELERQAVSGKPPESFELRRNVALRNQFK